MKRILAVVGLCAALAQLCAVAGELTITINPTNKTMATEGACSIRETVSVTIMNIGTANPTNLLLAVIDNTNMVAVCNSFVVYQGKARGFLNLNTTELVTRYASMTSGRGTKLFSMALWDTADLALLGNDNISILNNPYKTNMASPTAVSDWAEADIRYITNGTLLTASATNVNFEALGGDPINNAALLAELNKRAATGVVDVVEADLASVSGRVVIVEASTSSWNQAAINAASATGGVATLQADLATATGRVGVLEASTSSWAQAAIDAASATGGLATIDLQDVVDQGASVGLTPLDLTGATRSMWWLGRGTNGYALLLENFTIVLDRTQNGSHIVDDELNAVYQPVAPTSGVNAATGTRWVSITNARVVVQAPLVVVAVTNAHLITYTISQPTNYVHWYYGTLSGTNGVYFTPTDGTNRWLTY